MAKLEERTQTSCTNGEVLHTSSSLIASQGTHLPPVAEGRWAPRHRWAELLPAGGQWWGAHRWCLGECPPPRCLSGPTECPAQGGHNIPVSPGEIWTRLTGEQNVSQPVSWGEGFVPSLSSKAKEKNMSAVVKQPPSCPSTFIMSTFLYMCNSAFLYKICLFLHMRWHWRKIFFHYNLHMYFCTCKQEAEKYKK